MTLNRTQTIDEVFFEEYTSRQAILKYTKATAGTGISYLLNHDYKDIYVGALERLPPDVKGRGIRMLEFGCGGGMNLIHLVSLLKEEGIKVQKAVGTDFSPVLIDAARRESKNYLQADDLVKLEFHLAKNEALVAGISASSGKERADLLGSFDFVLGVNTIRYCHRDGRELNCASDIMDLLVPGGVAVIIDMNNRFPAFRSALKNRFRIHKRLECYIPSLDEYAAPFENAGFEILRKEHFCWIPHSGGALMSGVCRTLTPFLNTVAKSRAMRSLIVARKAAATG
jgi:SAM-dependent methyltransferase